MMIRELVSSMTTHDGQVFTMRPLRNRDRATFLSAFSEGPFAALDYDREFDVAVNRNAVAGALIHANAPEFLVEGDRVHLSWVYELNGVAFGIEQATWERRADGLFVSDLIHALAVDHRGRGLYARLCCLCEAACYRRLDVARIDYQIAHAATPIRRRQIAEGFEVEREPAKVVNGEAWYVGHNSASMVRIRDDCEFGFRWVDRDDDAAEYATDARRDRRRIDDGL